MTESNDISLLDVSSQQGEREKCCAKCKYFEERTCFCRFNPPIPVVTHKDNGQTFVTSVYSKINMPGIDWCQKFDNNIN